MEKIEADKEAEDETNGETGWEETDRYKRLSKQDSKT